MGKTIDNILGRIERMAEPWIIRVLYGRDYRIKITRTANSDIKENPVNYEQGEYSLDYRK